jgi:LmbE family N-acetylglucosaminyl deacetylase
MKPLRDVLLGRAEDALGALATRALPRRGARYHAYHGNRLDEDQTYTLPASAQRVPAQLGAHVEVPSAGVVLLSARVRSRGLGGVRDPWLELAAGEVSARCYVERGVAARRYLHVSALSGRSATLSTADLSVEPEGAEWLCFPGRELRTPVLVVAPHPDDAELAAFGLYAGRDAWVVTACAGELGTHDYGGLFSPDADGAALRGRLRVAESLSAPVAGGVPRGRIANLGYFDGSLAAMYRDQGAEARSLALQGAGLGQFRAAGEAGVLPARDTATWAGLVADLVHVLRLSGARTVAFPHPQLDHHPDHAALGMAVLEALERAERTDALLLAYAVHGPGGGSGASIHPVGRRDGSVSLPPGKFDQLLFDDLVSVPLDAATLRKKALALDTYRDLKDEEGPLPAEALGLRLKRGAREMYRALMVYDLGLVRRFLRPNELFYVLDGARLAEHRAAFAAHLQAHAG